MGSAIHPTDVPALTAIERIGPKGFLRYVFLFQLQADYDLDDTADVIKAGYITLKERFPTVGCEAVPDEEQQQAGILKLQRLPAGSIEDVVVKDLRAPGAFPWTYAQLKSKAFPVSEFDGDVLCRRPVWISPGERIPTSLVQANFIPGGLILTWCVLHMVGDGTSYYTWMKVWEEGCRRAQGLEIPNPLEFPDSIWTDREQIMKPSGRNAGRIEDHPEYTVLPFTPPGPAPKMADDTHHRGQIFYFSPAALAALKADASPAHATEPTDQKWISTNDALSALLWRTVLAVQSPLDTLEGDPVSVFNIALDGRTRTDPRIHPETQGCFLEYVAPSVPIRQLLGAYTLADIAIRIRQAVLRADNQLTDDVVALVDQLEDVNRLVPTAFLDVPGRNCIMTSWISFELYSLNWGPMLGGRIDAVRSPRAGYINGLHVVMPVLPDGGMEILVAVDEDCLDPFMNDPLWLKYAIAR